MTISDADLDAALLTALARADSDGLRVSDLFLLDAVHVGTSGVDLHTLAVAHLRNKRNGELMQRRLRMLSGVSCKHFERGGSSMKPLGAGA